MKSKKFKEALDNLNPEQRKAVDSLEGPVMVIAGPGTGKTQILALRIVNILTQTDTQPHNILCLTFQDSSVLAMRKRLSNFIGEDSYKVKIHTFHSFCNEVITNFSHSFDFRSQAKAIKDIDKINIFKSILEDNKLISLMHRDDVLGAFGSLEKNISTLKKEFVSPEGLLTFIDEYENSLEKITKDDEKRILKQRDFATFYKLYQQYLSDNDLIDFDDMIFKVTEKFKSDDEFVKYFQEKYLYTHVDEFQDTNNSQLEIIFAVSKFENLEANIFIVGDDDQTIFRFQGASSNNFNKFFLNYPNMSEPIYLKTNYRSSQIIIDRARSVIQNNYKIINKADSNSLEKQIEFGTKKEFKSFNSSQEGTSVTVNEFEHSFHEDFWILSRVKEIISSGVDPDEIAIIARKNDHLVNLSRLFDKENISYNLRKDDSLFDNQNIEFIINLIDLILDPRLFKQDLILWKILQHPIFDLDSFTLLKAFQIKDRDTNLFGFLFKEQGEDSEFNEITKVINKLVNYQKIAIQNKVPEFIGFLIKDLNLLEYLKSQKNYFFELNKISSFLQFIKSRVQYNPSYTLEIFLDEVDILRKNNIKIPVDPIEKNGQGRINLLTAHSSKGLEFDHVFIYRCTEDNWEKKNAFGGSITLPPLSLDVDSINIEDKKVETEIDERRLFYVAMTRAKNQLHLTYSNLYYQSDSDVDPKERNPSMFVLEAGIETKNKVTYTPKEHEKIVEGLLEEPELKINWNEENINYLKSYIDKNITISFSSLKKYLEDPKKYLLERIFKIPSETNINLITGEVIHELVQYINREVQKRSKINFFQKETLDINIIMSKAEAMLKGKIEQAFFVDNDSFNEDRNLDDLKKSIQSYLEFFNDEKDFPYANLTEKSVMSFYKDILIVGRIDKIAITEDDGKFLKIVDYKTTNNIPSITEFLGMTKAGKDKDHLRQLLFYRIILENSSDYAHLLNRIKYLEIQYISNAQEVKKITIPFRGTFEFKPRSNSKKIEVFDLEIEYNELKNLIEKVYAKIKRLEGFLD